MNILGDLCVSFDWCVHIINGDIGPQTCRRCSSSFLCQESHEVHVKSPSCCTVDGASTWDAMFTIIIIITSGRGDIMAAQFHSYAHNNLWARRQISKPGMRANKHMQEVRLTMAAVAAAPSVPLSCCPRCGPSNAEPLLLLIPCDWLPFPPAPCRENLDPPAWDDPGSLLMLLIIPSPP